MASTAIVQDKGDADDALDATKGKSTTHDYKGFVAGVFSGAAKLTGMPVTVVSFSSFRHCDAGFRLMKIKRVVER